MDDQVIRDMRVDISIAQWKCASAILNLQGAEKGALYLDTLVSNGLTASEADHLKYLLAELEKERLCRHTLSQVIGPRTSPTSRTDDSRHY